MAHTKRFDICLMNPPYENGLHLQFLKRAVELSDKVVSIQPCNWLFLKSKQKRTRDVRDIADKYYTVCDVYKNGTGLFSDVAFKSSISINYIDSTREEDTIIVNGLEGRDNNVYHSIDDVKLFGQDPTWLSIYKKIVLDKRPKLEAHAHLFDDTPRGMAYFSKAIIPVKRDSHEYDGKWVFTHTTMAGNRSRDGQPSDDWYTIMGKNSRGIKPLKYEDNKDQLSIFYVFDTEQEAQNLIDYMKTDFARSILFMTKVGKESIIMDRFAPWLDFTQHWDDDKLFKEFSITTEEQAAIRKALPDYYGIRH